MKIVVIHKYSFWKKSYISIMKQKHNLHFAILLYWTCEWIIWRGRWNTRNQDYDDFFVKSLLACNNLVPWFLIGRLCCQPVKSHVRWHTLFENISNNQPRKALNHFRWVMLHQHLSQTKTLISLLSTTYNSSLLQRPGCRLISLHWSSNLRLVLWFRLNSYHITVGNIW